MLGVIIVVVAVVVAVCCCCYCCCCCGKDSCRGSGWQGDVCANQVDCPQQVEPYFGRHETLDGLVDMKDNSDDNNNNACSTAFVLKLQQAMLSWRACLACLER
ncbi:unnamed protein product [Polarella glacialis]|uniref:Secreted protein n=1 Tax=Polarella glacialis TaxID=89957 RepID=A0A813ITV9_POLGL|nr:unnamed protein product [Polarella glacialis]CAE8655052.1 unnamed protein product [Polarella glacialis]